MRLLFLTPRYYPYVGGVEYIVKSVAERLVNKGFDVTVLCGESRIDNPGEEYVGGVRIVRWPVWAPGEAYHIPKMISKLKKWLLGTVKECDVVHFHSVHSILPIYLLSVLKNYNVRKVLTPHYHGTGHTLFRRVLWQAWRSLIRRVMHDVDIVHAVSSFEAELLAEHFNVKPVVIGHGVEEWLSEVEWAPSGYVMYSGRIEKYKNIHRLANIVKMLNNQGFNLELKVFGEGSFKGKLEQHLRKLGVKHELKPLQPYEEYINHLSKASLFGLLSEKEAYGQTVNEANAIGVPAVVVEPWGLNFKERTRTLITKLSKNDEEIAQEIATFIEEAEKQPKPEVPSWSQIANSYIKTLYC